MRIVSGKFRSKKLAAPQGANTRPTSDRARESVFNVLDSKLRKSGTTWDDISVADVFAGTGALGAEALSRGANALFAWEIDPAAVKCFHQNTACFVAENIPVRLYSDALRPVAAAAPVGLLFMDPPYEKGLVAPALTALTAAGWIDARTLCVIETARNEKEFLPETFDVTDERVYGAAKVSFVSLKNKGEA